MDKLTLYIAKTLLSTIFLTLLLLVGLEFIFSFVNEVRHVGTGAYTMGNALLFILFSLPEQLSSFFPMAALLGTLMGLGLLASRSELIIMRTAGLSIGDIIIAVLKLAAVLALIACILGEWVAPITEKVAFEQKAQLLSEGQAINTRYGIWMKDANDFVHIQKVHNNHQLEGVTRYRFDQNLNLVSASYAQSALYEHNHWRLQEIKTTLFLDGYTSSSTEHEATWNSPIEPDILKVVGVKNLDELSLRGLWQIIRYRQSNDLDTRPYQLALWQKIIRPFTTLVMMFLAIPFIFGPLRDATMGLRLLAGVLVGFTFFTFSQLFGPLTLVYQFPPFIGAVFPTALFLGLGLFVLKRLKT